MSVRKRPVATVAPSSREPGDDGVDERLGLLGASGGQPRRPAALGGVAVEGELRDHEQRRARVGGRHVHHAVGVVEDPQVPELVGQLGGGGRVVVVRDADEHAQPGPIDPTTSSPTVTDASVTRCTTARMAAEPTPPWPSGVASSANRPRRAESCVGSVPTVGAIDVNGVACRTPDGVDLLHDVSFRVGDGEHVALVGANGAGKTTLFRVIAGDQAAAGRQRPRRRPPSRDATARRLARRGPHRARHAARPVPRRAPARRGRPRRRRGRPPTTTPASAPGWRSPAPTPPGATPAAGTPRCCGTPAARSPCASR